MISNSTSRLEKVIRSAGFIFALSVFFLVAANSRGDAPSPPSFQVIKVKDLTDYAKVGALLQNSDPSDSYLRYRVGSVQEQQDGRQFLMVKGQIIFGGYNLSPATLSSDGAIAVSSYSGRHNQIDGDGSDTILDKQTGKNIQSISSVWIIDPSGAKHKITSDDMHATSPVISRDGHWLAFSGIRLDDKGFFKKPLPDGQQVYVVALQNGVASTPVSLNLPSRGRIIPVKWDKTDQLVVVTTESENCSTYQLTWVQITPGQ